MCERTNLPDSMAPNSHEWDNGWRHILYFVSDHHHKYQNQVDNNFKPEDKSKIQKQWNKKQVSTSANKV